MFYWDNYCLQQLIKCFKAANRDFEYSQYKEMVNVWGDSYANYSDLITAYCTHVLKCTCPIICIIIIIKNIFKKYFHMLARNN
jgi:hypothetical protein